MLSGRRNLDLFMSTAAFLICALFPVAALASEKPQIWFSAVDPIVQRDRHGGPGSDYMGLFEPGASWPEAAAETSVFEISTQFAFSGDEGELRTLIAGLAKRKIALAVSGLMLPGPPGPKCGAGIEGYAAPGWLGAAMKRLRNLGADVRYVAMDEPFWFGHYDNAANACHSTIEDVAREVATTVRQVKAVFPDVLIGDVEPVASGIDAWPEALTRWAASYQAEVGARLAFLIMDVQWHTDILPLLRTLQARAALEHLPLGIIYNGDPRATTSRQWVQTAEQRFYTAENVAGLQPNIAVIATWDSMPKRVLPENDPDTMTYLVGRYQYFGTHVRKEASRP